MRLIEMIQQKETLKIKTLFMIHDNLMEEAIQAQLSGYEPENIQCGSPLRIRLSNPRVPTVDFITGRIEHEMLNPNKHPVYVVFNGLNGPIYVPVNSEASHPEELQVIVPQKAVSGKISLLFPVYKINNPKRFLSQNVQNEKGICLCIDNQAEIREKLNGWILEQAEKREEQLTFIPLFVALSNVRCQCTVVSKCTLKAIEIDPVSGDCSVDLSRCKGQVYYLETKNGNSQDLVTYDDPVTGRPYFKRDSNEISCWSCFRKNEPYSLECVRGKIQKVAYLVPRHCCGTCHEKSKTNGLALKELCPFGAIYGGTPLDETSTGDNRFTYRIDQEKCRGCTYCYYRLNCYNNIFPSHNIQLSAYIPKKMKAKLYLKTIGFERDLLMSRSEDAFGREYVEYVENKYSISKKYTLRILGNKKEIFSFMLDGCGCHALNENIYFTDEAHLELFVEDRYTFSAPLGSSLATQTVEAKDISGGIISFKGEGGSFKLHYDVRAFV